MSDNFNEYSNVAICIFVQYSYSASTMKAKAKMCKAKALWLLTIYMDLQRLESKVILVRYASYFHHQDLAFHS